MLQGGFCLVFQVQSNWATLKLGEATPGNACVGINPVRYLKLKEREREKVIESVREVFRMQDALIRVEKPQKCYLSYNMFSRA
jgi:hypothetical protein